MTIPHLIKWVSYVNRTELVSGQVPLPSWLLLKPTLRQPKGPTGVLLPFRYEQNIPSLWMPWPQTLSSYFQSFHCLMTLLKRAGDGERRSQGRITWRNMQLSDLTQNPFSPLFPSLLLLLLLQRNWKFLPFFSTQFDSILRHSWSRTFHIKRFCRRYSSLHEGCFGTPNVSPTLY